MARHSSQGSRRIDFQHHDIPSKANRILHFILIALFLILIRIWHLSIIQYDQKVEESRRPQYKSVIEPAVRATIRDRFNLPLAINKISYQATILYSQIQSIPSYSWQMDASGKKIKVPQRKRYIRSLAEKLAAALNLEADRVEDLIYAKASFYAQVPFVIKDDINEREYYQLKMLEKDWPGIYTRHVPKRTYPQGRSGADLIGYMGAINRQEYEKILQDIHHTEKLIEDYQQKGTIENEDLISIGQLRQHLRNLEAKAYTIHDYVGKMGIESVYEEQLRGFYGKKFFYTDSKGNYLKEMPGSRPSMPGQRVLMTISAELQAYAEELLIQNESVREVKKSALGSIKKTVLAIKQPWIKGGAIVVMEPQTAEILALASYPRFDPNDYIATADLDQQAEKKAHINRWFENEWYLANIWNQQQPIERERYQVDKHAYQEEKKWLTWPVYLDFILPNHSPLKKSFSHIKSVKRAVHLQKIIRDLQVLLPGYDLYSILNLLYADEEHEVFRPRLKGVEKQKLMSLIQTYQLPLQEIKKQLDPYFNSLVQNYDKVLLIDLTQLIVSSEFIDENLLQAIGNQSLESFHNQMGYLVSLKKIVREMVKEDFHENTFKGWREKNGKEFLKQKRIEENRSKKYPKPYLDYFDQEEKRQFQEFWSNYQWECLSAFLTGQCSSEISEQATLYTNHLTQWYEEIKQGAHQGVKWIKPYLQMQPLVESLNGSLIVSYLKSLRPYEELEQPLYGSYRYLRTTKNPLVKHLASAFYPTYGFGYGRSYAYRQAAIQGSLFKLVTAYAALTQRLKKIKQPIISPQELNPLIIIDKVFEQGNTRYVGYSEDGKPIPQLYKGGRLPRSLAHQNSGRVDLVQALEVSSNPYFSLLACECLDNPEDLSVAAELFSFGKKTGIDLTAEIAGKVPHDLATNRTGLYAMAIGQHSLVVTPLQTAVMLSAIANGGKILKPKIVSLTAGKQLTDEQHQTAYPFDFPNRHLYHHVGIDFPLFTAKQKTLDEGLVKVIPTEVKQEIFMPEIVRQILLKGLKAAFLRTCQESMGNLAKLYRQHPEAIRYLSEFKNELIGKTSTSESVENIDLDLDEGTNIYTHVWFGSISFQQENLDKNKTLFIFKDDFGHPEVVVVVYLRYGGYGKEAAPLAAQMVKKWRELKQKYEKS